MSLFLLIISGLYAVFTLVLWLTWLRIPTEQPPTLPEIGPRITVIIPVRNEAGQIEQLLEDLSRQTYPNFEVIVADDSSTDNTLALVVSYAQKAPYTLRPLAPDRRPNGFP